MTTNDTPNLAEVLSYARRLIEEAEAYQISNADCDWDDVEGTWDDLPEDERPDHNAWELSTLGERLWDLNLGDPALLALTQELNIAYGLAGTRDDGALDRLQTACWAMWDFLTLEYGHEADTADDVAAPPFPR